MLTHTVTLGLPELTLGPPEPATSSVGPSVTLELPELALTVDPPELSVDVPMGSSVLAAMNPLAKIRPARPSMRATALKFENGGFKFSPLTIYKMKVTSEPHNSVNDSL